MREERRPLVTLALFAYNQESFIQEAIQGALAQDYSPLEIIISDDCSSDHTFEIIRSATEYYKGPHAIRLNRNARNLGLIGHVNCMFGLAQGEVIVAAAGDDISLPTRVSAIISVFAKSRPMLLHSSAIAIDDQGRSKGVVTPPIATNFCVEKAASELALYIGATGAWNIELYKKFGPIKYSNAYEDLVLIFRAALLDSVVYIDEPLVKYRVGTGMSNQGFDSCTNFSDVYKERRRNIHVAIDVYAQRLLDLNGFESFAESALVRKTVTKKLILYKGRLSFYEDFFSILDGIFSKNFLLTIEAFFKELIDAVFIAQKYLIYSINKIFK